MLHLLLPCKTSCGLHGRSCGSLFWGRGAGFLVVPVQIFVVQHTDLGVSAVALECISWCSLLERTLLWSVTEFAIPGRWLWALKHYLGFPDITTLKVLGSSLSHGWTTKRTAKEWDHSCAGVWGKGCVRFTVCLLCFSWYSGRNTIFWVNFYCILTKVEAFYLFVRFAWP